MAKGGKLKGKSPERIAFLRELMESLPSAIEPWYEHLGKHCPRKPFFILPEDHKYKIDGIDTWNMTRKTIMTGTSGITWLDLGEAKEGIALLAVEE